MAFVLQAPGTTRTHTVEWSTWLPTGDAISSGSWAITPTGPTVADLGESGTEISADVSDLTYGVVYRLTCAMVSDGGETEDQSIEIRCGFT